MEYYLYNGVKCPALPDIAEDYPYVFITGGDVISVVRAGKNPAIIKTIYGTENVCFEGGSIWFTYDSTNERWREPIDATSEYVTTPVALIWSNHNICKEDGSVYLPASEPVPVGDEPEEPVPVARESDFYKVVNRQWVKHDAVKPADGEWVKQPQKGYETQGGQWSALS